MVVAIVARIIRALKRSVVKVFGHFVAVVKKMVRFFRWRGPGERVTSSLTVSWNGGPGQLSERMMNEALQSGSVRTMSGQYVPVHQFGQPTRYVRVAEQPETPQTRRERPLTPEERPPGNSAEWRAWQHLMETLQEGGWGDRQAQEFCRFLFRDGLHLAEAAPHLFPNYRITPTVQLDGARAITEHGIFSASSSGTLLDRTGLQLGVDFGHGIFSSPLDAPIPEARELLPGDGDDAIDDQEPLEDE